MIGVLVSGRGTNLQALLDAGLPVLAVASNVQAAPALERARAQCVALDAARLTELPTGGNAVLVNEDWLAGREPEETARVLAEDRRLSCVTLGVQGAIAVMGDRVERVAPERTTADAPGSGDVFAGTLLVALGRGDDLADALSAATRAALDWLG